MSLDNWIGSKDVATVSESLTCKYYNKETNTCPHYDRGGRCHKLLIICGLSEQLEVSL